MPTLLILGATSDMARATALEFASHGWSIQLAGRNQENIARIAQDIAIRTGQRLSCHLFDAMQPKSAEQLWSSLQEKPDAVLCAVGILGDQDAARHDTELAQEIITCNFTGLIPILSLVADAFEERGKGCIIGISSVAGDRGRASNYVYGSAKAGFTAFLSGLRNRLSRKHIQVMTVKPGFVTTRMTENMDLPPALTAFPNEVATAIWNGVQKKRNVIYVKRVWYLIMLVIKHVPESLFKFMKI